LHYFYNDVVHQLLLYYSDEIDPWLQDRHGMTVLHWVSWSRRSTHQALTCFRPKGGDSSCYSVKDVHGKSMLHYAVQRGNADLIAFFLASPDAATMLMPDFSGKTLLHYSTESSRTETIDAMLKRDTNLDVIDNQGRTILHHAAMRGNLAAAQRLIELGATHQLRCNDHDGHTPADLACRNASASVRDYFKSLGYQCHDNGKRGACSSSGTNMLSNEADGARWKTAILIFLTLTLICWRVFASG
jgi:ankyrin repeat protein